MKYGDLIARSNPMQTHWDLNTALTILEPFDIRTVLEIGLYQGGTFLTWAGAFKPTRMVGVTRDDDEVYPDCRLSENIVARVREETQEETQVDVILGLSQDEAVIAQVKQLVSEVDFLFIDGGHSIDEITTDFRRYSPLVRKGGVIGLHDVNRGAADVWEFWQYDVTMKYPHILISDALVDGHDGKGGGLGIGLVFV